jgi:methylmalonyl-CoA mutase
MEGGLGRAFEAELADAAAFAASVRSQWPKAQALRANGRVAHEAGASAGQELAFMLASGVAHLRAMEGAGVGPAEASPLILFTLSAGPDVIVEIAKLRAARLLWARVMEACGAAPAQRAMALQAITSRRMMTRHDAWTNILRATAACFAAAAGGADVITVLPMTTPLGEASAQARRLARNTQIILMEESHLGRVADPGGGAFAIERLTADLAETAWGLFQKIEAEGGIAACLRAGSFQKDVAAKHEAASRDVARRKAAITGLSDFPLLGEQAPAFSPAPRAEPVVLAADAIAPLKWARLSEPFEALRDAGERSGSPAVFFANLGPLAEFSARANFAKNLFAVGGVAAHAPETDYPGHVEMAAAMKAAGLRVAVLTGADARYAAEAPDAAKALKASGCDWLIYAGKPGDEAALRAVGFDQFIFAGQDAVLALKTLHASLGIAP